MTETDQPEIVEILRIKDAVRDRDGYRCVACGMTNEQHIERYGRILDVHRKEPGSVYAIDGCETLCKICHAREPKRPNGTLGQPKLVPLSEIGALTLEEVAARYDVIPRAVQKWIQFGWLPAVAIGRGNRTVYLVREKDLKGFEKPKKGPVPGGKRKRDHKRRHKETSRSR